MYRAIKFIILVVVVGSVLLGLFFNRSIESIGHRVFNTFRESGSEEVSGDPIDEEEENLHRADTQEKQEEEIVSKLEQVEKLPALEEEQVIAPTPSPAVPQIHVVIPEPPAIAPTVTSTVATSSRPVATSTVEETVSPVLPLPPLDEKAVLRAIVKIQCPAEDNKGIYVGSGFVIGENTVVTAAHVVMNAGSQECDVIFPKERMPIHFLRGTLEDISFIKKRHDEEGIDVAFLTVPSLDSYPEARAIFNTAYPSIPYPVCVIPPSFGDALLHFGYPSNFKDQSYLSSLVGEVVGLADIAGIENQLSLDQTIVYKTPIFAYSNDATIMHPYIISRVPSFYGDSGGLAFNKTKQCILGPSRGGTIGNAAGENFTIFMNIGWERARDLF
jgi:hypothetical protein